MSAQTITVGSIDARTAHTKYGPKNAYDIFGTDGTKYQFGFKDPAKQGLAVGTTFVAEVSTGKYGPSIDPATVSIGGTPVPKSVNKVTGKETSYAKPFPVPALHGDMAIIRQNSLTNAVATVADFVATRPSEEWPDIDKWTDMVIDVAYKYAKFSSGHREAEVVEKAKGLSALAAASTKDTDDDSEEEDD